LLEVVIMVNYYQEEMKVRAVDIIHGLQVYHSRLADYYCTLAKNFHEPRSTALIDYLEKCEAYQVRNMMLMTRSLNIRLFNTIIDIPGSLVEKILLEARTEEEENAVSTYEELLKMALQNEARLKIFCRDISKINMSPELRQLFSGICSEADKEIRNLYSYICLHAS